MSIMEKNFGERACPDKYFKLYNRVHLIKLWEIILKAHHYAQLTL